MSITYRQFSPTDIPAVIQIINRIEADLESDEHTTVEWLEQIISAPYVHADDDFFIAESDGEVVGGSLLIIRPDNGMALSDVIVHPDFQNTDITAELVKRSEARASQRAQAELADEPAAHLNFGVPEHKKYLRAVLDAEGYVEVRRAYVMRMSLDTPIDQPNFPPEFSFRPFDRDRDAEAVHRVFQECFADHFGGVARIPFDQWALQIDKPQFDPTLWHVLMHGDEIAAICLCELNLNNKDAGFVEVLGVRPMYRQRGLGGLLLRHAFHDFQQRGFKLAALDVDAENTTNAVSLYEKAGMSVYRCTTLYRKMLLGDPALINQ